MKEVRSQFDDHVREKSVLKGLIIFTVPTAIYIAVFIGFLRSAGWPLKLTFAAGIALCIDMLFIVGHDGCHQALTPIPWLNKLIGRIAFLPSLHSYSHWDYGHNGLHHGWTNVRGKDPVFVPLSKAEYDKLSPFRKWQVRMHRSPLGIGWYYMVELWGPYAGWPTLGHRSKVKRPQQAIDWCLVMAYAILQIVLMLTIGRSNTLGIHSHILAQLTLITVGFVLPFLFWNWSMGFVIFQHHTHPEVPWFKDVDEWTFFEGQVESVVHVELPRPIELFLHNILDHTAHHVDPKIPLYNLPKAQQNLETAYPKNIKVVEWTYEGFKKTFATCRLYDYENHRWIDYDGTPTSERHKLGAVPLN